jgi:hypothetical protein
VLAKSLSKIASICAKMSLISEFMEQARKEKKGEYVEELASQFQKLRI